MSQSNTRLLGFALLGVFVSGLAGCATTQTFADRRADRQLERRVGRKLVRDRGVRRHRIDVDAVAGVVMLRGEVPSAEMKEQATVAALKATDAVRVENQLTNLGVRREAIRDEDPDRRITRRIRRKLARSPETKARNIDIDSIDGVVYLSGVVENQLARETAVQLAADTTHVDNVVNDLMLEGQTEKTAKAE